MELGLYIVSCKGRLTRLGCDTAVISANCLCDVKLGLCAAHVQRAQANKRRNENIRVKAVYTAFP